MSREDPQTEARLIEHLVGSVLGSIVKAQGLAASQLVELIETVGFEPTDEDGKRQVRMFDFDFMRSEVDTTTNQLVQNKITASVPLLTLINLPAIAIDEAKIGMDLRLVAHEASDPGPSDGPGIASTEPDSRPLKMYVVPAKKQVLRSQDQIHTVDAAGTIKINVTMRQEEPLGISKITNLLESGSSELLIPPEPEPDPG